MKKKNYALFCSELQRAYDEGAMYLHENGKQYPLVEKKYSLNKEYRLVIAQNSIAFQLFKKRLIQRIKENEEMNEGFGTTNLTKMLKMPMTTTSWVREVLKTLHDNQTTYVDETGKERLLVMKKKTKYILMGGKIGFKEFKTHFDKAVSHYAQKPKNYLSYFQIMAQLGVETTHKKLNESLNDMYSERLLVAHPNGCVSPAVQRFRIKHYVLPFLSSAPAALAALKNRLMQNAK
jgi:hypothetical protein